MNSLQQTPSYPLCVDLDGTLIRSDLLIESFLDVLRNKPGTALSALFLLRKGRAQLKERLAHE